MHKTFLRCAVAGDSCQRVHLGLIESQHQQQFDSSSVYESHCPMLFSDRDSKTTGTRPWCLIYSHMLSELGLLYEPKLWLCDPQHIDV